MTREEAIKIFNTVLFFGKCDCPKEEIEECLKMAIQALEQEPRWIPVSERLPEDNKIYLVTIELVFDRNKRYVSQEIRNNWDNLKSCGHEVIAWMPLPKPYEPQESEDKK